MIPISILRPYFPLIKNKKDILPDIFKNKDRVYIPFEGKFGGEVPFPLRYWFRRNGYLLVDYKLGLVKNRHGGSPIRIGKLLRRKNELQLLRLFETDKFRSCCSIEKFLIVLSRHPYDLLGMSYGRGWKSCFSLRTPKTREKVIEEINNETIIFYLCHTDDYNIKNPIGRILYSKLENGLYKKRTPIYGMYAEGFSDMCDFYLDVFNVLYKTYILD